VSVFERQSKGILSFGIRAIYEPWLKQEPVKLQFSRRIWKGSGNKWMNTGSIEGLHSKVDGLKAGVAEIRAMMQEVMKRLPVVEQPAVQPR
jgi:hypothetical protein